MTQIITKPVKKENIIEKEERVKESEIGIKEKIFLHIKKKILGLLRNFLKLFKLFKVPRINKKAFYHKENRPVPENVPYFNNQRIMK
jgi:hypothetical protein